MKWLRFGVIPAIALLVNGGLAAQDAGLGAGEMQLHQVWATPSAYTADTGANLPAFSQSPTLDAAVASGDLPPVEDRLPIEPLVVLGVDGPGLYGGTFFNATYDVGLATALRDETAIILNKHSFTADPYPNVTKSYTAVDDSSSVWELKLREGLLWSDGTPFTTADFTFWWDDVILNTDITPQLRPQYRGVTITAIDDYTVQFDFGVPADFVARGGGFNPITRFPRHYLEQFHAEYANESDLADMVKKSGFESWTQFFLDRADYNEYGNVDKPTLEPWELSDAPPADPVIWTRNPYFWVVDTEGKQLPYFEDRRTSVLGDQEVVKLKALNGEVDYSFLDIDVYTLAKKSRAGRHRPGLRPGQPRARRVPVGLQPEPPGSGDAGGLLEPAVQARDLARDRPRAHQPDPLRGAQLSVSGRAAAVQPVLQRGGSERGDSPRCRACQQHPRRTGTRAQ